MNLQYYYLEIYCITDENDRISIYIKTPTGRNRTNDTVSLIHNQLTICNLLYT